MRDHAAYRNDEQVKRQRSEGYANRKDLLAKICLTKDRCMKYPSRRICCKNRTGKLK
ncbi:hypothetical protein K6V98_07665 [Collinsella sp. AGMB00827]|uniref:Uncharacterized protein n=1 Tax=Collinsella ureilytica TaxID=2869515 RepID=A0ABS7MLG8_9ACTN|nr:hypothetical protein [Collinsella urealyticum]